MFTSEETPSLLPTRISRMINDNTLVGAILVLASFNMLQKPSSSKPTFDFDLFSSSEESQGEEEKPQDDANDNDTNSECSTLDIGYLDENFADPFALLELRDSIVSSASKVDSPDKQVANLDSIIYQKVTSLNSKLELILKYLFEIKYVAPSELDQANQLDQLISLQFKHTVEEVEQKYNNSLNHHISIITTTCTLHDYMINFTDKPIKQTHFRHEKQIQRLEKEIHKENEMNMIMQHVLLKLIHATWNVADVLNNKFYEMLVNIDETFSHHKFQAPTVEAYNALSK
ncbi:unnamed protein product [Lactuca saligna]|uniref:Uncharacterized protein n=1 Tax=Lactuca saligna TaxID=75948 RepID=A0AA35V418_LACSI|nr:unnamed protein product [Lactuca saligna]